MSGIATYTRQVAKLLEGSNVTLLDTRKTTPNCRVFEKYAVRVGGGCNHRYNLSDGVLLKDNHIGAAGSVTKAVQMAKAYAPFVRKIEIEVETLDQVKEAAEFLIEIMPVMFIPAGVGLLTAWGILKPVCVPIILITVITTVVVMIVTGRVTQAVIRMDRKKGQKR